MSRILLVDDEPIIRAELVRLLVRQGHTVAAAGSVAEALDHPLPEFDLVIADVRLPGEPGTALIPRCEGIPVLLMTSFATVQSAVEAMKAGAADYISKPFDHDDLLARVDRLVPLARSRPQEARVSQERVQGPGGLVGVGASMREVFERIRRVALTGSTVLVLGESGTGKELVAHAVHDQGPRRAGPFVAVNCASIPEGLIESELFGHEKGAFTGAVSARAGLFQAADEGTLFLDEVGELPLPAQGRLLRVLQDNEVRRVGSVATRRVDVRLIAATHRDLPLLTSTGRFREDLYHRLRVLEIRLPPLRERHEDLLPLTSFLLEKACERLGCPTPKLSQEALEALAAHSFPGNVRELANALERAVILCEGDVVSPELLALGAPAAGDGAEPPASLTEYFKHYVLDHQDEMSETELARNLGISRKTLWERRIRLGLPRSRQRRYET